MRSLILLLMCLAVLRCGQEEVPAADTLEIKRQKSSQSSQDTNGSEPVDVSGSSSAKPNPASISEEQENNFPQIDHRTMRFGNAFYFHRTKLRVINFIEAPRARVVMSCSVYNFIAELEEGMTSVDLSTFTTNLEACETLRIEIDIFPVADRPVKRECHFVHAGEWKNIVENESSSIGHLIVDLRTL